ncbi:MAG TPA: hypothetical protein VNQ76_20445, partial [Planctomicrobium sp.]|nr:hypothetical protein [Planctomicrobium sp.]
MPRQIFLDQNIKTQEAVRVAASELEAGEIICLPDDCGWHLMGLAIHGSSSRLLGSTDGFEECQAVVSVPHASIVNDYLTDVPRLFQKLSARCWPGPVVLRGGAGQLDGLARQWPVESQSWG